MAAVPAIRIRAVNDRVPYRGGDYVLYWMIAHRRVRWNFGLERAVHWAAKLRKPLLILEALRCDYPWASDRLHRFVLQGMADNRAAMKDGPARYYAYVEPQPGHGRGLLAALAERACVVVTDEFPCFFLPRMVERAGQKIGVLLEAVDSNGLLPMRAVDKVFARAHDFRRFLHRELPQHLAELPKAAPFQGHQLPGPPSISRSVLDRWPEAPLSLLRADSQDLAELPVDHAVGPAVLAGGMRAARRQLNSFLDEKLIRYADDRNHPDSDASSGLSPYLHFGHLSAHEVFARVAERERWSFTRVGETATGARSGWWGMSLESESFLDELITWRELGFNRCWLSDDYDRYDSLPAWARETLADHAGDQRQHVYSTDQFERAETHDILWNAAQRQLVREGRLHNYLRMLWGKKILEWSASPQAALEIMIHLNNKYAVDGRDPNSYSGIFWILGRYDRAWGPERPVFGKVRYMSSENTRRKLRVEEYLERFGPP